MNDVGLSVFVTFDDGITPTIAVDDMEILRFIRRTATTVVSPDVVIESSAGEESAASGEESSAADEWIGGEPAEPEEGAAAFAMAEPYASPEVGTYSSGKYSGGQSFYVPWDASYLNKFVDYVGKSIGAIVYVALFCSLAYFGIQMLSTVIENFKNRKG